MSTEAIGVDLGGTKMLVGVVDASRAVLHRREAIAAGLDAQALLDLLAAEIDRAREARPDAVAAGVGIPCTIDRERGVAISAVHYPISNLPIRDELGERLGLPVLIDNDANLAALAEHRFGAAEGARNAVVLTVGTGIGGGLILNGELYRGSSGAGAELGHVVVDLDGPPCPGSCPNRGCIEAVASGPALAAEGRAVAEADPASALVPLLADGQIDGEAVTDAARAGDPAAMRAVETIGRRLGAAISGLANAFEPDVIVIGGGVAAGAGELLLGPAREELQARALAPMNRTPLVAAHFGPDAGMIGAATMAMIETGVELR